MIQQVNQTLSDLYESDETAWLEAMADLIQQGRLSALDYSHLQEYLSDMARRDRREVESRMTVLLTHVLKWRFQPNNRTNSWRATIIEQQQELEGEASPGVLRNHAGAMLPKVYKKALVRMAAETGLPAETLSAECPYTVEELLSPDLLVD